MTGPIARYAGQLAERLLPRRTVRLRLTLLYGGLFLLSGAALLAVTYALVAGTPLVPIVRVPVGAATAPAHAQQVQLLAAEAHQHNAELHQLLVRSGIALAIMVVVSIALGWLVAGRVLRPLRTITYATQRISEENLHERLSLFGPRDEVKDLADTIDGLLGRLESAFDAQRSFVANASHELRTPLTLARALVQMRLREPATSAASFRATCEEVLTACEQQERLIESLLTLARSQRGLELEHRVSFDLAEVVRDVGESYDCAAAERNVTLEVRADPTIVFGDPGLTERLAANLVDNAIRYNKGHGWVKVVVRGSSGLAVLEVANTGPMVSDADVGRLLNPFQRSASERAGDPEGLGLGLSLVAAIAKAHDATLVIRSRESGGLDIVVDFPSAGPAVGEPAEGRREQAALAPSPGQG